jgi:hypothetical protein
MGGRILERILDIHRLENPRHPWTGALWEILDTHWRIIYIHENPAPVLLDESWIPTSHSENENEQTPID